jgi:predicted secreted hydrolase
MNVIVIPRIAAQGRHRQSPWRGPRATRPAPDTKDEMQRRTMLTTMAALAGSAASAASGDAPLSAQPLRFPDDHAAHPRTRIEWWYVTGYLSIDEVRGAGAGAAPVPASATSTADAPQPVDFGFQLTFFRSRTGLGEDTKSRFAARQLVFAHAALTDLGHAGAPAKLHHDQRAAREGFGLAATPGPGDAPLAVAMRDWSLVRERVEPDGRARLALQVRTDAFALSLSLAGTQPRLLQGDAGWSRKGPLPGQASRYYSEPQLAAAGTLARAAAGGEAAARRVRGRAWLDHEWSNELLAPEAVGWDWLGIDFLDGGALTAFQLRRADGSTLWAGGSWRASGDAPVQAFAPEAVRMTPGRTWRSAATDGRYPVEWRIETPAGRFTLHALLDDQELDSRRSTGSVYWEGLAELRDAPGRRVGLGYLEMTGRAGRLRL